MKNITIHWLDYCSTLWANYIQLHIMCNNRLQWTLCNKYFSISLNRLRSHATIRYMGQHIRVVLLCHIGSASITSFYGNCMLNYTCARVTWQCMSGQMVERACLYCVYSSSVIACDKLSTHDWFSYIGIRNPRIREYVTLVKGSDSAVSLSAKRWNGAKHDRPTRL